MNVIAVIIEKPLIKHTERYRIFSDTESGRKKAVAWAVENGYESMMPLDLSIGMLNYYNADYKIGIIRLQVEEDNLNEVEK